MYWYFGIYTLSNLFSLRSAIGDMVSALSHRGPDKSGCLSKIKSRLGTIDCLVDLSRTEISQCRDLQEGALFVIMVRFITINY